MSIIDGPLFADMLLRGAEVTTRWSLDPELGQPNPQVGTPKEQRKMCCFPSLHPMHKTVSMENCILEYLLLSPHPSAAWTVVAVILEIVYRQLMNLFQTTLDGYGTQIAGEKVGRAERSRRL